MRGKSPRLSLNYSQPCARVMVCPLGERDKEIAKKATVRLDSNSTDGRESDIVLPLSVWQGLKTGDPIQVWAYAYRPKWIFWSPMIRSRQRKIWMRISFTLTTVFMFLVFLSIER